MKVLQSLFINKNWSVKLDPSLDSDTTLLFAFYDKTQDWHNLTQEIKALYPKSTLVGCSTSGEILKDRVYDQSFCLTICKFEKTKVQSLCYEINDQNDSFNIGQNLAQKINPHHLNSILLLSDGLNINGSELIRGVKESINNKNVIISGGLAGDGDRFKETTLLFNNMISSKQIIALAFYGESLKVGTGSVGGWDEFGPKRTVTKSKENILFELDGEPALEVYKKYLGEQAKELPASGLLFPLSISFEDRKNVVRTILAVDESNQTLTFAGDIPQNSKAQLMRANFTRLVDGAKSAAEKSISLMSQVQTDRFALAISCVGRRLVLGQKTEDELEAVYKILPAGTALSGFYSYGELSPNGSYGCELHNQTMTITFFEE